MGYRAAASRGLNRSGRRRAEEHSAGEWIPDQAMAQPDGPPRTMWVEHRLAARPSHRRASRGRRGTFPRRSAAVDLLGLGYVFLFGLSLIFPSPSISTSL